ncbi:MAG: EF-hand domain-containing protein [Paracoccaceae bacterium]
MKKFALVLAASALVSTAALAEGTTVADVDGNGAYSLDEMKAAFPDLTEEVFTAADADASGDLSADELKAAQDAGNIPA